MPRIAVFAALAFGLASLAAPANKKDDDAKKAKKPARRAAVR